MTRPTPHPSPVTRPFWEACARHELVLQRCAACSASVFYPRSVCPVCGSSRLGWEAASGTGTLYSYTVARRATHRKLADRVPYVIAIVELDEGPRLTSTVVGTDPDDLTIGARLRVDFEDDGTVSVPVFRVVAP
ncbi:Zn-ribbon domain-containing OB-fold protein [Pseudonocardia petroleophila]|uniref:Zn-ribbon domain-containing OB-fold protein n=1 Tax=Pseudonocardia petroleophila TaxID=37331 RepID=A0A7G7MH39_9PSEU|nr:Zn-ribbon domain-containing OB-fold protein [Pseudonocardia petroleophila]QNG52100.1 Zn-ribbon domain-containing OB-fold protein [Pseudonocardia petroleophila]